ncbi:SDR family NAD(P)-dependent oxidoreductase [Facilibium subflavum]|uniref:SDR family NAD(P)-dependent oxidoreductase n=1 Tax=Facilibium subflavum TaxID=2219058 RepID=UPI000E6516B4|nr:SDR family oxidoreductase [Facilibium subflavum]
MKKHAVITGASRGIGFAVAEYFAQNNYHLTLIARDSNGLSKAKSKLQQTNHNISINSYAVDLSQGAQAYQKLQNIAQEAGEVDVVFNNAGVAKMGTLELEYDDFSHMIDVNVKGFFSVAQIFGRKLKAQNKGYIINLSSMSGKRALTRTGGYAASKFAVIGFNQALRQELAPYNVKVTAICPGMIDTDMTAQMNVDNNKKMTTRDITNAVDFLLKAGANAAVETLDIQTDIFPT